MTIVVEIARPPGDWPHRWEDTFALGPDRPVVDTYSLQVRLEFEARAHFLTRVATH